MICTHISINTLRHVRETFPLYDRQIEEADELNSDESATVRGQHKNNSLLLHNTTDNWYGNQLICTYGSKTKRGFQAPKQ